MQRKQMKIDLKKEIVQDIQKLSGKYSTYQIFTDWIAMFALAIQNSCNLIHDAVWKERETKYMQIIGRYEKNEISRLSEMCAKFVVMMQKEDITDWLGEIYMESGCGNKSTGQFFTPFHLSKLTANMMLENYKGEEKLIMQEPSTGGGGMILAAAAVLKEKQLNYQRLMDVVAQDLDWNGVYMTYIQLSYLGIPAIVVQGDTLVEPYHRWYDKRRVFRTPAKMGILF